MRGLRAKLTRVLWRVLVVGEDLEHGLLHLARGFGGNVRQGFVVQEEILKQGQGERKRRGLSREEFFTEKDPINLADSEVEDEAQKFLRTAPKRKGFRDGLGGRVLWTKDDGLSKN